MKVDSDIELSHNLRIEVAMEGDDVLNSKLLNQREGLSKIIRIPLEMMEINPLHRDIDLLEGQDHILIYHGLLLCPEQTTAFELNSLIDIRIAPTAPHKLFRRHSDVVKVGLFFLRCSPLEMALWRSGIGTF